MRRGDILFAMKIENGLKDDCLSDGKCLQMLIRMPTECLTQLENPINFSSAYKVSASLWDFNYRQQEHTEWSESTLKDMSHLHIN